MQENYNDVHHYIHNDYEKPKILFEFIADGIEPWIIPSIPVNLLDVGCAKGEFLYYLKKRFAGREIEMFGVDFSQTLIGEAQSFHGLEKVSFILDKAEDFTIDRRFDVITATGLLPCYDDYKPLLENLLNHLAPGGRLMITNGFSMYDYDVILRYRHYRNPEKILYGWNQHSLKGIETFMNQRGKQVSAKRFELPFPLEKTEDVIRSWTLNTEEGVKFTNGLNIIWNLYSLIIR
jgi:SAM-dependent methyltransferase